METLKQFLVFSLNKPFFITEETETSKKVLYISGNRTFFLFQERNFQNPGITDLSHISGNREPSSLIFLFKYKRIRKNFSLTYKEAKFSKLKYFLIIIIKRFFTFYVFFSILSQFIYFILWEIFVTFSTILSFSIIPSVKFKWARGSCFTLDFSKMFCILQTERRLYRFLSYIFSKHV